MKHKIYETAYGFVQEDGSVPEAFGELCELGMFEHKMAKLMIKWRSDLSKNSQIMILKKLYPILNEVSVRVLLEEIRKNGEQWEFAEMGWGKAMDLVNQAAEKGLDIQIEEIEM